MHADAELNLEFPEQFHVHVSRLFPDSTIVLNSSERYYGAVAHSRVVVEPLEASRFYDDLLDFGVDV